MSTRPLSLPLFCSAHTSAKSSGALFAQAAPVPISHIQARSSLNTLAGLDLYQGNVNQLITRKSVLDGVKGGAELASGSGKVGEASTSEIEEVTSALSSPHTGVSNAQDEKLSSLHGESRRRKTICVTH